MEMLDLRHERDIRLAISDRFALVDAPLTTEERAAWATYRQALRDLPATYPDPLDWVWPTPPGVCPGLS